MKESIKFLDIVPRSYLRTRNNFAAAPELILLTTEEFCAMFNLTSRSADEWKKAGVIPHIRIRNKVYYRLSDVAQALDKYTRQGEEGSLNRRT